jgi:hypothetical protein
MSFRMRSYAKNVIHITKDEEESKDKDDELKDVDVDVYITDEFIVGDDTIVFNEKTGLWLIKEVVKSVVKDVVKDVVE